MLDENHLSRLLPEAREFIDKSIEERIEYVRQDRWLPYPKADALLDRLEAFYKMPDKIRPPSMLIVGDSHCGKSSLVRRFKDMHPPTDGMYESACPVFYLPSCPTGPDEDRLYDEILQELMVPFRYSDKPAKKFDEIRYQFDQIGVKVIIIDEISHALSGSAIKLRVFLNAIKNLHNVTKRPIVLVGTQDARFVAGSDRQFESRFKLETLERWKDGDDFRRFLAKLEMTLPFPEPSLLASQELSRLIFNRAESGCIGDFVELVSEAAIMAIKAGKHRVTENEIKNCSFSPSYKEQPSERLPNGKTGI